MRFICLHGQGTNVRVLEVQLSAVLYQLGDRHTYEFVEGTVPETPALEIKAVFSPNEQYFGYFDETSPESCLAALNSLERYLEVEGPFDGVIAFSQGGALASTLLVRQGRRLPRQMQLKVAIFFSGGVPADPDLLERGVLKLLDYQHDGEVIHVPTAHIMGKPERGELQWPSRLLEICSRNMRETFRHEGGHEVPGSKDRAGVAQATQVMRRAIWMAEGANDA